MEKIIDKIIKKAKEDLKTIILPEAQDTRVLTAARAIKDQGIARVVLVGDRLQALRKAKIAGVDIEDIEFINPVESEHYEEFVHFLYELRKEKGMTVNQAREYVLDPVYFGVLMVKKDLADGLVSGACHSTADTLRPALQIIKAKRGTKLVSSFFLMEIENSKYEKEYIFSDCGLIPNPDKTDLAEIAILANDTYKLLIGDEPKVALLSYSTLGSAKSESTTKVMEAKNIINNMRPDIVVDGELQLDAALDENVASLKAPTSHVAGHANVLIFPNLDAGNIGYKLVERFAGANAYGPITQGLDKPINDLSRGCKSEDIVGAVAITAVQAQNN
ncbi:MAG: phosphate acetyltransferase [Clostridia bacterium]|nr:phosphate acetyltransferase [Clostridia bacterium]